MTKLEDVARAIKAVILASDDGGESVQDGKPVIYTEGGIDVAEVACAAIEALREPSEAMLRAAYDPNGPTIWRDMIDAALEEKPEPTAQLDRGDVGARIIGKSRVT